MNNLLSTGGGLLNNQVSDLSNESFASIFGKIFNALEKKTDKPKETANKYKSIEDLIDDLPVDWKTIIDVSPEDQVKYKVYALDDMFKDYGQLISEFKKIDQKYHKALQNRYDWYDHNDKELWKFVKKEQYQEAGEWLDGRIDMAPPTILSIWKEPVTNTTMGSMQIFPTKNTFSEPTKNIKRPNKSVKLFLNKETLVKLGEIDYKLNLDTLYKMEHSFKKGQQLNGADDPPYRALVNDYLSDKTNNSIYEAHGAYDHDEYVYYLNSINDKIGPNFSNLIYLIK